MMAGRANVKRKGVETLNPPLQPAALSHDDDDDKPHSPPLTTVHHPPARPTTPPPLRIPTLPASMGRSLMDEVPVTLYFVNQSDKMCMEIGWIDYDDALVPRKLLHPGESHLERSWATHPWMLTATSPSSTPFPAPTPTDMCMLLRVGSDTARDRSTTYSVLWQPRERSISVLTSATTSATHTPSLPPIQSNTDTLNGRVRMQRTQLLRQLHELRVDPSGGANGGDSPLVKVSLLGNLEAIF